MVANGKGFLYSCYYLDASNLIGRHGRSWLLTLVSVSMDLLTLQLPRLVNEFHKNLYLS